MFVLWGLSFVYCSLRQYSVDCCGLLRTQASGDGDCRSRRHPHWQKGAKNSVMWSIAALAFIGIFLFKVPFPGIVFSAGLIGFIGGKLWKNKFYVLSAHRPKVDDNTVLTDEQDTPEHAKPSWTRALCVCVVCGLLWWAPILLIGIWCGWDHTLFKEGVFFSKAAMVTFGGAYAVLPYVAQQAVEKYGWLKPGQMMDGLGLAETTPGPLIMCCNSSGLSSHGIIREIFLP
jgi:chromate transporter